MKFWETCEECGCIVPDEEMNIIDGEEKLCDDCFDEEFEDVCEDCEEADCICVIEIDDGMDFLEEAHAFSLCLECGNCGGCPNKQ